MVCSEKILWAIMGNILWEIFLGYFSSMTFDRSLLSKNIILDSQTDSFCHDNFTPKCYYKMNQRTFF